MPEIYQNLNTSAITFFETKSKVEQQHGQQQQRIAWFKNRKHSVWQYSAILLQVMFKSHIQI